MAAQEGICRFCAQRKPLIRAHIIPQAFFRAIGTGRNAPLLVTTTPTNPHPKRAPIGVYDTGILCDDCERRFDKVDAYGTKTLLHTLRGPHLKSLRHANDVIAFQAEGIDQELLRRFFVATLWRASVSTHSFFVRVRLGERYEKLAKDAVADQPLTPAFGAAMACWLSPEGRDESVGFMDPFFERYDGVNTYRFYFGPYLAYIKVDQKPFKEPLLHASLGVRPDLVIIRRDHRSSKDFAAMVRTARVQYENSIRAKRMTSRDEG